MNINRFLGVARGESWSKSDVWFWKQIKVILGVWPSEICMVSLRSPFLENLTRKIAYGHGPANEVAGDSNCCKSTFHPLIWNETSLQTESDASICASLRPRFWPWQIFTSFQRLLWRFVSPCKSSFLSRSSSGHVGVGTWIWTELREGLKSTGGPPEFDFLWHQESHVPRSQMEVKKDWKAQAASPASRHVVNTWWEKWSVGRSLSIQ